jgi:uncharacterized protein (DUF58 family)
MSTHAPAAPIIDARATATGAGSDVRVWPNRYGWLMLLVLAVMLIGAINYGNNLGYALTFLLLGVWFAALLHGYRNLKGVQMIGSRADPVFAGDPVRFDIFLRNNGVVPCYGLQVTHGASDGSGATFNIAALATHCAQMSVPTSRRGMLVLDGARVQSLFPLATTTASSRLSQSLSVIVYPRPAGTLPLPLAEDTRVYAPGLTQAGTDDFAGLRSYRSGDPLRQIDWKVFARERGLQVKQFAGGGSEVALLRLHDLDRLQDEESRLSQLARWVLDAEDAGIPYGLQLDDGSIATGLGEAHRDACLRMLALAPTR